RDGGEETPAASLRPAISTPLRHGSEFSRDSRNQVKSQRVLMMNYPRKPGGLRSMRRIPVALTDQESAALHWLRHFAREEDLPRKLRPFRKLALHRIIKALSIRDIVILVNCHARTLPDSSTPTP